MSKIIRNIISLIKSVILESRIPSLTGRTEDVLRPLLIPVRFDHRKNKLRMRRYLLILSAIFVILPAVPKAQESELGNWFIYFGNKNFAERFNWHHEVQYRNYNFIGDLEQLLLRTGIGYNLTENNNNVLLGYGFILSENYLPENQGKETVREHRIYQQFITRQKIGIVHLQHRYRFEQRFIEDDFKLRFRYFLSLNVPINNKEMADNTVYLSAYNEIFLNTQDNYFDRNRLYGGVGYKLNNKVKFELGYMNQIMPDQHRDQINIVTFINF
jgi:hypothetical protein